MERKGTSQHWTTVEREPSKFGAQRGAEGMNQNQLNILTETKLKNNSKNER